LSQVTSQIVEHRCGEALESRLPSEIVATRQDKVVGTEAEGGRSPPRLDGGLTGNAPGGLAGQNPVQFGTKIPLIGDKVAADFRRIPDGHEQNLQKVALGSNLATK
jgi:hypothetical protein